MKDEYGTKPDAEKFLRISATQGCRVGGVEAWSEGIGGGKQSGDGDGREGGEDEGRLSGAGVLISCPNYSPTKSVHG